MIEPNTPLTVLLFASAKDIAGADRVELTVPTPTNDTLKINVVELKAWISHQYPSLQPMLKYGRIAIDQRFANDQDSFALPFLLSHEVALIPPVSGG